MDLKVILILVLLFVSYMQYSNPEKTNKYLDSVWGKAQEFVNNKNPLNKNNETEEEDDGCPDTVNPVCGSNGITYINICKAAIADILQVTPGEC